MDTINFDDFEKVDVRIGTVIKAEVPEWSHWVMKLEVEIGDKEKRICFSGISKFFKPEELEGKQFPFVVNLEPRKIGPNKELSEVMMIMACPGDGIPGKEEETPTVLFDLQKKVPNGTKVR
jgi:methionyl-tRNA synthetase